MVNSLITPFTLLQHQVDKYTELLAAALQTDDFAKRAFLRSQLYNCKQQLKSHLN